MCPINFLYKEWFYNEEIKNGGNTIVDFRGWRKHLIAPLNQTNIAFML